MDDHQGALYTVLKVLEEAKINIEYSYAFASASGAYVVFRVDDVTAGERVLLDNGIKVAEEEDIKAI